VANKLAVKFNEKLISPLLDFLKQGMTPGKLALSIALGFSIGLFPVIGVTTIFSLLLSIIFKLNVAAVQLINYFVYPIQLILIIPLIKFGSWLLDVNPIPLTINELFDMINKDFFAALERLWVAHLFGIFAWIIIVLPIGILIYFSLRLVFLRMAKS
jgi:uncharacterized protein (DUF2062 family)